MYITPHVLVGASVGLATGNPIFGFIGGVASHYVLDAIPHADSGTLHYGQLTGKSLDIRDYILSTIDVAAAVLSIIWLSYKVPFVDSASIWGALGGAAPDSLVLLKLFLPKAAEQSILKAYYYYTDKIEYTVKQQYW